ncbi:hypothetical protein BUALT_Bualt12G0094100 [Buddleja alternifolia]|uniref:Actin-related protein 10 n=1 Tax=Buddleja alternifolia TaxID=168488 RepID=A0AAV6WNW3_9LAMI|nr:hypothetical protein BUALT_Bualt12G0094100 [Buddleja alternifolia]
MDGSFITDDVKEKLCLVSLHLQMDLNIARCPVNCCANKPQDRRTVDLTKNEFSLTNEWFLVPKMIFRPADLGMMQLHIRELNFSHPRMKNEIIYKILVLIYLGMNQAELAECIVRVVNSCHPHLYPVLYESIILTGGSTLFPGFAQRLCLAWGSLLASSPDFEAMCVAKAEYEELGSARIIEKLSSPGDITCAAV